MGNGVQEVVRARHGGIKLLHPGLQVGLTARIVSLAQ